MLSVVNYSALKCCERSPTIWDKAAYCSKAIPWIDIAIGIILCVIGKLVLSGIIPIGGAQWFIGIGATQIALGGAMKLSAPCYKGYKLGAAMVSGWGEAFTQWQATLPTND